MIHPGFITSSSLMDNVPEKLLMEGFAMATEANGGDFSQPLGNSLIVIPYRLKIWLTIFNLAGVPVEMEEPKNLQQGCATSLVAALDPSIESVYIISFVIACLNSRFLFFYPYFFSSFSLLPINHFTLPLLSSSILSSFLNRIFRVFSTRLPPYDQFHQAMGAGETERRSPLETQRGACGGEVFDLEPRKGSKQEKVNKYSEHSSTKEEEEIKKGDFHACRIENLQIPILSQRHTSSSKLNSDILKL